MSAVRRRNLTVEREITQTACEGHNGVDPEPLIAYSEVRAAVLSGGYVNHPLEVLTGRDRSRDVREELADARNHLVWHIEDYPGHPDRPRWMTALRLICEAYAELT